jgi:leucyl aminopeptidase
MLEFNIKKEFVGGGCLILPFFEDKKINEFAKSLDNKLNGLISKMINAEDFEGKKMQMSFSRTSDKDLPSVLVVGLGEEKDFNIRLWKQVVGASVITMQNKKIKNLSLDINNILDKFDFEKIGTETAISVEVSNYSFDEHKTEEKSRIESIESFNFVADLRDDNKTKFQKGINDGVVIAGGVNYARHLGNTPPSIMTPTLLAEKAKDLAKENDNLKAEILSRPEMEKLNMGCLLGVSRGSAEEPKFIILEYYGAEKEDKPTVLVGKGITFDSGGLGIKPGNYMNDMKFDMLGAATVLGIIKTVAKLKLKKNIIGLIPACENMPSGTSYRPDDILTAHNGKTVEIIHTDAEGRLILADALSYATQYEPKEVIDFATLTGACMVALGNERSGLFGSEDDLIEKLKKNSDEVGEQLWHLPIGEEYTEAMKSEVADIKNLGGVGAPGHGGASTAAAFLQAFTDYPWAHIDLSSSYYLQKGKPWIRHGANGFGIQTLVEYLSNQ